MAKEIFLIRHAHAEDMQRDTKDIDRVLTDDGCQDAMRMGKLLAKNGHIPDLILSSVAERARETTKYFCEQLGTELEKVVFAEDLYESSVRLLLGTICKTPDQYHKIYLVAHNPSISFLAESLTGEVIGNMAPGAVVHLESDVTSWQEVSQNSFHMRQFFDPINL